MAQQKREKPAEKMKEEVHQAARAESASAQELNHIAHSVFPEDSIFRIDHYLGKEAIMNIL